MKASSATSAKAATEPPRHTDRSSARPQPTRTSAEGFALSGPSDLPEPAFHAYRKDLADAALAGRVIASHYADPVQRTVIAKTQLCTSPSGEAEQIRTLEPGEPFWLLDDSRGWAWGYAGDERRVGYVASDSLSRQSS